MNDNFELPVSSKTIIVFIMIGAIIFLCFAIFKAGAIISCQRSGMVLLENYSCYLLGKENISCYNVFQVKNVSVSDT